MTNDEKIELRRVLIQQILQMFPPEATTSDIIYRAEQLFKYITGENNESK